MKSLEHRLHEPDGIGSSRFDGFDPLMLMLEGTVELPSGRVDCTCQQRVDGLACVEGCKCGRVDLHNMATSIAIRFMLNSS